MLFNNILLTFDGSEGSIKAADYAIGLCALEKATLIFIHVLDNLKQGGVIGLRARYGDVDLVEGYMKSRRKNIEELIKPIEKRANDQGIKTNLVILNEEDLSKLEVIINFIESNNIDLVLVGSRGYSKYKQLFTSSLASELISHSKCPILVIR